VDEKIKLRMDTLIQKLKDAAKKAESSYLFAQDVLKEALEIKELIVTKENK
jgi:hypothetical protein